MKLSKKLGLAASLAGVLFLAACGDDGSSGKPASEKDGTASVPTYDDLAHCTKSHYGEIVFVEEESAYFECTSEDWAEVDESKLDSLLAAASSSSEADEDKPKSSSSLKADSTETADVEKVEVDSITVKGFAQKGPFASGTAVTVYGLDSLLEKTKTKFTGKVSGDSGAFKVEKIVLPSQYALVEVSGYYQNEVTGKKTSGSKTTLSALVDLSEGKTVKANVNLFTDLEYARAKHLVLKEKFNVPAAKKRATKELLSVFGGKGDDDLTATTLSLSDTTSAGKALLFASILLQGDLSASKFGILLGGIEEFFGSTGGLDSAEATAAFADWASKVDSTDNFAAIRENVKAMKLVAAVPDFESALYAFWTKEYGLGACTDSLESTIEKNSNKKSENYGAGYACTAKRWHKATALDTELGLCTGKMEGQFKEYKGGKSTEYYVCKAGSWNKITETQFELKECTEDRDNEYVMTKDSSYFVCSDKQWKELDADGFELKDCNKDRDQKIFKTKRENYYKCVSGEWEKTDKLSYELQDAGACTEKNNLDSYETESFGIYVCDNKEWREATEPESEFGVCGTNDVTADSIYKTEKSNYFVCTGGVWERSSRDDYEFQQLGACTQAMNLETHETESHKKFVCDNLEWREPTSLEREYGVCGSATVPKDSFVVSTDKYYVCLNKKWTETDSISYELKTRCIEANNEKRMKTSSDDYYGCVNRSDNWNWTSITLVEYEYGFCSKSNSNYKVMKKASDNTYWYCDSYWKSISDTVYLAGDFCYKSRQGLMQNGWTCENGAWRTSSAGEKATNLYCQKNVDGIEQPNKGYACVPDKNEWRKATSLEITIDTNCYSSTAYNFRIASNKIYRCTDPTNHSWTEFPIQTLKNTPAGDYGPTTVNYHYATLRDTSFMVEPLKIRHKADSATNWICEDNNPTKCTSIGVKYTWKAALAYDSYTTLAGHIQGACPSGWHVPNTAEAIWLAWYVDDIYYRVNRINGNTNATQSAWISYDVEHTCPAKQLNGQWITYCNYAWKWSIDQSYFTYPNDAYKQTDYFYVYCIKTN